MRSLVRIAPLALALACAATPEPPADPGAAIQRVLAADAELSDARNHAPERGSMSAAMRAYVAGLDRLDLAGCPDDFRAALHAHRDAWSAAAAALEPYSALRGEMHAVLERIAADGTPEAAAVAAAIDAVWSTWSAVEAALVRHGVDAP